MFRPRVRRNDVGYRLVQASHSRRLPKAVPFLAGIGIVAASLLGGATPAFAHATLLFSSPAANSTVTVAPSSLTFTFNEPVTIGKSPVNLKGPHGPVTVGAAALTHGRTSLSVAIPAGQGKGIYQVHWQVTSEDGDIVDGSYPFAVGPKSAALGSSTTTATKGGWETAVLRGLLFAALALSIGELAGVWLLRRVRNAPGRTRSWMPLVPLIGLAAAIGLTLLQVGDGSLSAALLHPSFAALTAVPGIVSLIEAGGFALTAIAARVRRPQWAWLSLAAVIAAEALRAHPGNSNALLGMPLTVFHLGAAMLWAGTLTYVLRTLVSWRHNPTAARAAIAAYSRPAVWLFVVVVLTGFGSALLVLPLDQVFSTTYGQVLLIKIGVVMVVTGLAWAAQRRLRRTSPVDRIRRPARLEAVSLAVVLALSAVLTTLPPPADPNSPLPFAPPASGPIVPVAALAGSVEVSAQASAGQLVVQLSAPDVSTGPGQNNTAVTSALTGTLADPAGKTTTLNFRTCGTGCYVTPVTWKNGSSQLILSPTVGNWATVKTGLTVPWPARPAGDLLSQAISTMKAIPALTLYQRVTGNSSTGPGPLSTFHISGAEFIGNSLYGKGKVPAIVRLPDTDGNHRLAISYPADGAVDELTIAPDGKILNETLTASNLVTYTLAYPEPATKG